MYYAEVGWIHNYIKKIITVPVSFTIDGRTKSVLWHSVGRIKSFVWLKITTSWNLVMNTHFRYVNLRTANIVTRMAWE